MNEKKTILVADDELSNLELITYILGNEYKILSANNGEVACKVAQKKLPDLIIMDWQMPVLDGIEASKKLKMMPDTQDIPIIISTGVMTSPENLKTAFEAGAMDFVRKPINEIELIARVNSALALLDSYRQIKKQKEEIEAQKDRQLSSTTMHIYQKNDILASIEDKLESMAQDVPIQTKLKLKEIKRIITDNQALDKDWASFQMHFEQVHADFFKKLQQDFPNLTNNELKFCAYIKIHLSIKEVARLLSITVKGVKMARYRLKKKLALDKDTSLNEFIAQY